MTRAPPPTPVLHFGPFKLDIPGAQLTRDGAAIALRPKAFDLLAGLAQRPQELVTKDELLDSVWGRRFITEGVIKSVVAELRTALDDDPKQPQWIETVPRRGYRFMGALHHGGVEVPAVDPDVLADPAGNVPANVPATIGRDKELAALTQLLDTQNLVTIAGPSGVGKTRLALALADSQRATQPTAHRDGVWFIELASLVKEATDVPMLCAMLTRVLRFGASAATDAASMAHALRPLKLLLVLDNGEHLLEPLSRLVDTLLAEAPGLRIVVTSQEPLGIGGEQVFRLGPLDLPVVADDADAARLMQSSAVRLFVDRVAQHLQGFALAPQQQHAVASICRALDGMPLALELAAARVPLLGVHGIAELLLGGEADARLQLLTRGSRTAMLRQRSLRDAIQWSHDLLDEPQRRVFRRLGVFLGGFSLEAAQAVCADDALDVWAVLDAVNGLIDKSFLTTLNEPTDKPRFGLLESLRAFALERLADAGEEDATRSRHLHHACTYWERADDRSLGDPGLSWTARHAPEMDNLRAALRWAGAHARHEEQLSLVVHTPLLWSRTGLAAEGKAWCEAARAQAAITTDTSLRLGFDFAVATLALYLNAYRSADAMPAAQRAAEGFEQLGDAVRCYFALYLVFQLGNRGHIDIDRGALVARMKAVEHADWSPILTRFLRTVNGYELRLAGDAEGYLAFGRSELALCRRLGAKAESWVAAQGLMLAEHDLGRREEALVVGREALADIRAAGRLRQYPALLALWTTMLAESGDTVGARQALAETLPVLHGASTPWMACIAFGWLAAHEGRPEDAARLFGWHAASEQSGRAVAAGGYIARSAQALVDRLESILGAESLAIWRESGSGLGDAGAEQLVLRVA
jgi:predicted ATPase/DNA-binding winged helix-turn-helix (wHTH) protein